MMIKNSLKKTLGIIRKDKYEILLIFFLQIIFFISLSLIFYHTIEPAMKYAKNAMDYYDEINISESSGMFGYLGENPLVIYESYNKMLYYLRFMFLFSFLAFIIINSMIWDFSDNLVNKKDLKQFSGYILNFIIITLAFALLFYALIFNRLRSSLVKLEYSLLPLIFSLSLFFILIYFLFIGFSLIEKRGIKDIFRLMFLIGVLKFHYVILVYLINLFIILLFSYLLYLVIEANIILLVIVLMLFVFSFVFIRLFLIVFINDITKKI